MPASPKVYRWPDQATELLAEPDLLIATVHTPKTQKREMARQQLRAALFEILARRFTCPIEDLCMTSSPGEMPKLAAPYQDIGISFSHASGCSIIAINPSGPVGVDLLDVSDNPPWAAEIIPLATDYLGPAIAECLHKKTGLEQVADFSWAWVEQEAKLKTLGLALTEWSIRLGEQLAECRSYRLSLATNAYAAIALPKNR